MKNQKLTIKASYPNRQRQSATWGREQLEFPAFFSDMIDDNAVKTGALSSVPLEVAWAFTVLSRGKIESLTTELKIRAFHRQLFKKSITLLEFCERQVVRILICRSVRRRLQTVPVRHAEHHKPSFLSVLIWSMLRMLCQKTSPIYTH